MEGFSQAPRAKKPTPEQTPGENDKMTRRTFLRGAIAAALASSAVGVGIYETHKVPEDNEVGPESPETFTQAVAAFKMLYDQTTIEQVLFIDADGKAVGDPVAIEPIDGVSPGKIDYNGVIFPKNISKKWYDAAEAKLHREHPDAASGAFACRSTIGILYEHIFKHMKLQDRPVARKSLTLAGVVQEQMKEPTPGHEDTNLLDYVRKNALSRDEKAAQSLPKTVVDALRELIPGIAAQESHFDPLAKSNRGAEGIFQFLPETLTHYFPGKTVDTQSVVLQTEAVGMHFLSIYRHLQQAAGSSLQKIQAQCFDGDEAAFERHFVVPAMVNAYNCGQGTLAKVINRYVELHDGAFPTRGYDVYDHMRKEASADRDANHFLYPDVDTYGRDSAEYTLRVYAMAEILKPQA